MQKIVIGIDPGTKTGFAVKTLAGEWLEISTLKLHRAFERVKKYAESATLYVVVEDARKRVWFGNSGREKLQGAGSVKRDCKAWEDFLADAGVLTIFRKPARGMTKINPAYFTRLTGYTKRTSTHARDAAMLVHGITPVNLRLNFLQPKNNAKK
jgi:hypothetical protein